MKLNKLLTVCLALLALVSFSNCNSDDPEPSLEGLWAINELSSTIDIINKNTMEVFVTTDCGFSSSTPSQSTLSTSRLRINADQTGNLNLDGNCVEVENFDFSWQLTDDNKLIMNEASGNSRTWNMTSLTAEEVTFNFATETEGTNTINKTDYIMTFKRL